LLDSLLQEIFRMAVPAATGGDQFIVRVRGLPWSCKESELTEFMDGVNITSVHFTKNREGRPSGDAYLVLNSLRDQKAAQKFHKAEMGNRYLEVFEARYSEMSWMLEKNVDKDNSAATNASFNPTSDSIVRLRGLPFEAGGPEVRKFFDGCEVSEGGILICKDGFGRPSGEAFCQFETEEAAEEALKMDNQNMGHRYIEVFKSTMSEAEKAKERTDSGLGNEGGFRSKRGGGGGFGGGFGGGMGGYGGGFGGGGMGGYGGGPMRGGGGFGGGPMRRPGPYDRPNPAGQGFGRGGRGRGGGGGYGGGGFEEDSFGQYGAPAPGQGYGRDPGFGRGGGYGAERGGGGYGAAERGGYGAGGYGAGGYGNGGGYGGAPAAGYGAGGYGAGAGGYGAPAGGAAAGSHLVRMRGLPFRVSESEIKEWFSSVADCQDVRILYGADGRPNGQADVCFATHGEAQTAMTKHKQNMQSRYIELFYDGEF